jgi:hypothetical protein
MCILLLCNISQIATGVPYSESPRNIVQSGPILIKIKCNLTCFRPVQNFDLLGWGFMSFGCSQKWLKKVGIHVLRVLSKITQTSGSPILVLGVISSHSHLARISLPSHSPLTFDMWLKQGLAPIPLSSHFRHVTQVRWFKFSSINRISGINNMSKPSRSRLRSLSRVAVMVFVVLVILAILVIWLVLVVWVVLVIFWHNTN